MARQLIGEILVKLREGDPVVEAGEGDSIGLVRGGAPFKKIDDALVGLADERVRMCFPRYAPQVRRRNERRRRPAKRNLDHFLRIPFFRTFESPALLSRLRSLPEVEWAVRAPVLAGPPSVTDFAANGTQGYLRRALGTGGVDAEYAWTVSGGDGFGVRVCVCDVFFHEDHVDLPDVQVLGDLPDVLGLAVDVAAHGTEVLGVLGSLAVGGEGTTGIAHAAEFVFSSVKNENGLKGAIDAALAEDSPKPLRPGDILLLEVELTPNQVDRARQYQAIPLYPAEADPALFELIRNAVEGRRIVVIECAGNGGLPLQPLLPDAGSPLWDPTWVTANQCLQDADFESNAIIVGSGCGPNSASPHAKLFSSNCGGRVDCQGWGEGVATTTSEAWRPDLNGTVNEAYTSQFGSTSSAAAIVGGVVACVQGVAIEQCGVALSPSHLRTLLRNPANGTSQTNLAGDESNRVGPLPDLLKLLPILGSCPDVFIRDSITDDGTAPSAEIEAASPDIIVQHAQVADPGAAFGATVWDQDDLSEQPLAGSDNFVYARVKNRGTANEDVRLGIYWTEPSTFLTPDTWRLIGEEDLTGITPGEVRVSQAMTWAAAVIPAGGASLIAVATSQTQASVRPEDLESDADFQTFVREHNEIAYRSVLAEDDGFARSARRARRRFHVRRPRLEPGHRPPRGPCGLGIRTNLPRGTQVELASADFAATHSFKVGFRKNHRIADLGLSSGESALIDATITLPARASGKYRITFQQYEGKSLSGSVTMLVNGR